MGKQKKSIQDLRDDLHVIKQSDKAALKGGQNRSMNARPTRSDNRIKNFCRLILPQ